MNQLEEKANANWNILSNGVVDVIIVGFDSPVVHPESVQSVSARYSADDAFINKVLSNLGNNYVAAFTSNQATDKETKKARAVHVLAQLGDTVENPGSIFPTEVVEAVIVMVPFVFILYVGLSCTSAVQSVLKYDAEVDQKRRQ